MIECVTQLTSDIATTRLQIAIPPARRAVLTPAAPIHAHEFKGASPLWALRLRGQSEFLCASVPLWRQFPLRASVALWHNLHPMAHAHRIPIARLGEVTALVYEPAAAPAGTLVLAHGAGADQRHRFMVALAEGLADRGVRTATFNFLYAEQRRRGPDRPPVLEQTWREVVAHLHTRFPDGRLIVGGKSMGGRIASQVLAGPRESPAWRRVSGLVLLGYPLHPPGKPGQQRTAHLPALEMPVLLVQGTRDPFGTRAEVEPVFTTLPAPVDIEWIEGGDHSFVVPKSSGRTAAGVMQGICDRVVRWIEGD